MTCSAVPLVGDRARIETLVPVTASGGFGVTEIARIYVPPSPQPLALEVDVVVGATTAGQTANIGLVICPAAAPNLLATVGGRTYTGVPSFSATNGAGTPARFTVWPPEDDVWPPGDYILGANRGANAADVGGNVLAPGFFWWHR